MTYILIILVLKCTKLLVTFANLWWNVHNLAKGFYPLKQIQPYKARHLNLKKVLFSKHVTTCCLSIWEMPQRIRQKISARICWKCPKLIHGTSQHELIFTKRHFISQKAIWPIKHQRAYKSCLEDIKHGSYVQTFPNHFDFFKPIYCSLFYVDEYSLQRDEAILGDTGNI